MSPAVASKVKLSSFHRVIVLDILGGRHKLFVSVVLLPSNVLRVYYVCTVFGRA